ncbi:hypothetical protein CYLTODRAFT_459176 [Cylindrobasidium torrendii FP15055 ss-10]|uniref:Uncharacterized protein n=1 Tax=Cylindrobasidium torrendii FP15055 ss-10 TaxID=1314674 RepID=A0A0D7AVJ5_9AGAR|nr:hypothetical protein CYLTODRAFT_459176 [Cylindrobasidium torrendii FP15055 ss-10]
MSVRSLGYTCLVTQSDLGSEAYYIARGHSYIRQCLDPDLEGTLQHRWRREKKNIPPEVVWSGLRRRFTPGFEDILSSPDRISNIRYDRFDPLQYSIFKWLFIDWLQMELDAYALRINNTRKRRQKHKILPQGGAPNEIEEFPEEFNACNFKASQYMQDAEALYAPPDHETFRKVSPEFELRISRAYASLGNPEVTRARIWNVYMDLLIVLEQEELDGYNLLGFEEPAPPSGEEVEHLETATFPKFH